MFDKFLFKYSKIFLILLLCLSIESKTTFGKDTTNIDKLISIIENKGVDWRTQIAAIKEIAVLPDPRGLEILLRLINDPFLNYDCPALKFHASEALGKYKNDSRVIETLINVVSDNDNPLSVREAAINSLGEIGDKRALNILLKMLSSDSFALRLSAIRSLGKIGDPSVIPYLEALDKETDLKREIHIVLNMLRANGVRR